MRPFILAREASAYQPIPQFVDWKNRWWTVNPSNVTPAKTKEAIVSKLLPRRSGQILQQPKCVGFLAILKHSPEPNNYRHTKLANKPKRWKAYTRAVRK